MFLQTVMFWIRSQTRNQQLKVEMTCEPNMLLKIYLGHYVKTSNSYNYQWTHESVSKIMVATIGSIWICFILKLDECVPMYLVSLSSILQSTVILTR